MLVEPSQRLLMLRLQSKTNKMRVSGGSGLDCPRDFKQGKSKTAISPIEKKAGRTSNKRVLFIFLDVLTFHEFLRESEMEPQGSVLANNGNIGYH